MDTERLKRDDARCLWHPFTQMAEYSDEERLVIAAGRGCWLVDTDGKRYLDGVSSLWANVHGHGKRRIDEAIKAQLDKIAHSTLLGLCNVPSIELAGRLVRIAPKGLSKVFYSEDGAEAVEIALKIAFQYWRQRGESSRTKFVHLANSYHGDTIGAVSVGGIDLFRKTYGPLLFDALSAPAPYHYRPHPEAGSSRRDCDEWCLERTEELLAENTGLVAAMIVEPLVQGAAGMIVFSPGYLGELRGLCDKHGILMIADEVATGFGRTGRMFACEHESVGPDVMAVGKGLSGGYLPLAATLVTDEIYEAFLGSHAEGKAFFHGHTYTGNPLACAAALASLDVFEEERVLEGLGPKIERFEAGLRELSELSHVGEARGRGLMGGAELVLDKGTKRPYDPAARMGHRAIMEARRRGVILRPLGDVIVLMPPLAVSIEEMDLLFGVARDAIVAATEGVEGGA